MNISSSFSLVCAAAILANIISFGAFLTGEIQFSKTVSARATQSSADSQLKSPRRCSAKLPMFTRLADCPLR